MPDILNVREKMIKWREKNKVSIKDLSLQSGVSTDLLGMVERGHVTHPAIAKKIGRVYGLNEKETWELMPENHRPNSPRYDPDMYKEPEDSFKKAFTICTDNSNKEAKNYVLEKQKNRGQL